MQTECIFGIHFDLMEWFPVENQILFYSNKMDNCVHRLAFEWVMDLEKPWDSSGCSPRNTIAGFSLLLENVPETGDDVLSLIMGIMDYLANGTWLFRVWIFKRYGRLCFFMKNIKCSIKWPPGLLKDGWRGLCSLSALSVGGLFLPCLQGQVLWGRPGLAALCDRVRCLEPALVSAPGV